MGMVRACMPLPALPAAAHSTATAEKKSSRGARVLVLGGTGRVGWSAATALSKLRPDLSILIGGRNREKGKSLASKLAGRRSEFVQVDIHDPGMLEAALYGVDLVVHAAGPFQREDKCTVLEAAISTKTPYIDVCDDADYSWRAKGFHEQAKASGVPAIITTGICPGVSNVMAAELVHAARSEKTSEPETERLRLESLLSRKVISNCVEKFFYYIAGSGGLGPTTLASSFLLLGEDVIVYNKGEEIKLKPYSGALNIDFGKGVGKKNVYLLNLPEVKSAFKILSVPTVSARFGADPFFWNWGMHNFANFLPISLGDKNKVLKLVDLVDPIVRTIDGIAGECVSMRVVLEHSNGKNIVGLFTHKKMSVCNPPQLAAVNRSILECYLSISVGYAVAAFVLTVLDDNTQPGVWFPEEPEGIASEARKLLLKRATEGATNFVMNKRFFFQPQDEPYI